MVKILIGVTLASFSIYTIYCIHKAGIVTTCDLNLWLQAIMNYNRTFS